MMYSSMLLRLPLVGIPIFVLLYIVSSFFYPGGSQADVHSSGFSWFHNYWCNLLDSRAINGQLNTARHGAMAGMISLVVSLSAFWLVFPTRSLKNLKLVRIVQVSGVSAMATSVLLGTTFNHDLITNLASAFGLVAVSGTLAGLYNLKHWGLFWYGVINLLLIVLNNLLYYNSSLIIFLPLVQKISFASFLVWFYMISLRMDKHSPSNYASRSMQ